MLTPIYSSVATKWPNPKSQHIYPRYNTGPNVEVVSARIAALEGGEAGCVFGSGMAAITSTLFTFLKAGDHCVMSEVRRRQPTSVYPLSSIATSYHVSRKAHRDAGALHVP
jgi:cystathionine beta-lyase/cystathionine gamma-synthase